MLTDELSRVLVIKPRDFLLFEVGVKIHYCCNRDRVSFLPDGAVWFHRLPSHEAKDTQSSIVRKKKVRIACERHSISLSRLMNPVLRVLSKCSTGFPFSFRRYAFPNFCVCAIFSSNLRKGARISPKASATAVFLWKALTLSLPSVINVKFLLQPHQKYNITQYEERGFS